MPKNAQLRAAWKQANDSVKVAEDRLAAAWVAFAKGESGPPDKQLLEEVARLRRECDKRLKTLLDAYGRSKPGARSQSERPDAR